MPNTVNISAQFVGPQGGPLSNELAKQIAAGLRAGAAGANGFKLDDRSFTQPLGRINAGVKQFDTTLSAANKRVISFGVSVGLLGGSVRVFQGLISATRDVERSLAKISSVMALTSSQTNQLSKSLFDLARQTGTSFDEASQSVEEFAKQGGNLVQTLERSKIALALAKVGNIDAKESVDGLIAAYTQYGRAGESYISLANKISAATRSSVLGIKEAMEGVGQFGAEALDAGVSVSKLLGILAALKTATGDISPRNLNAVFANLQNPATVKKLSGLPNFSTTDQNGQLKESIVLLNDLAKAYQGLNTQQQSVVKQALGGTFRANTAQVLLNDIGGPDGVTARISQAADNSANDLRTRLIPVVNNLDQAFKNLKTTATQVGSTIGELSVKPLLNTLLGGGNLIGSLFGNIKSNGTTKPAEDFGAYVGESILKGIGNVLAGPGLVIISRLFAGAVSRTFPEVINDVKQTVGFTSTNTRDLDVLKGRNLLLERATAEERLEYEQALSVTRQHEILNTILQRQLALLTEIKAANASFIVGASGAELQSLRRLGGAAGGYVSAVGAENAAIGAGIGGASSSARAVTIPNFAFGGGIRGPMVANTSEFMVQGANGSSIYNRDMIHRYGLPAGAIPVSAGGYIPNSATGNLPSAIDIAMGKVNLPATSTYEAALARSNEANKVLEARVKDINESLAVLGDGFQEFVKREQSIKNQLANINIIGTPSSQKFVRDPVTGRFMSPSQSVSIPMTGYSADEAIMERNRNRKYGIDPTNPKNPSFIGPFTSESELAEQAMIDRQEQARKLEEQQRIYGIEQQRKTEEQIRVSNLATLQRQQGLNSTGNRINNALLIGSFAGAFIPPQYTQAGTKTGQVFGGIQGGLTGGAVGGQIGSIFGPEGTIVGSTIGVILGAIIGSADKLRTSFENLAQAANDLDKRNQQQVQGLQNYISGLGSLKQAQDSGLATPKDLQRIDRENKRAFLDLPFDTKKLIPLGSQNDPAALNAALAKLIEQTNIQSIQGAASTNLAAFAKTPNNIDAITGQNDTLNNAADSVARLFDNKQVNNNTLSQLANLKQASFTGKDIKNNVNIQERTLAPLAALLKTVQSAATVDDEIGRLSGDSFENIQAFIKRFVDVVKLNQEASTLTSTAKPAAVNLKAIQDSIQNDIDNAQEGINGSAGLPSFTRRRDAQRISAVARILSSSGGKIRSRGELVDSGGLEGQLQIQDAQQQADLVNSSALAEAKQRFRLALKGNVTGESDRGIETSINNASSGAVLQDILDKNKNAFSGDDKLDKVNNSLQATAQKQKEEVDLVREQVKLQAQELEVAKQSQLLLRGSFNLKSINEFSQLGAAASFPGLGRLGAANQLQAQLQQSELLDSLGLPKGSGTEAYQYGLRKQSAANQLSFLDSRTLGRRVGTDEASLQAAAQELAQRSNPGQRELGQRGLAANKLLFHTDPQAIAQQILAGQVGGETLSKGVATGQISKGDAGIIEQQRVGNAILLSIATNTTNKGGLQPPGGSTAPAQASTSGVPGVKVAADGSIMLDPITVNSNDPDQPPLPGSSGKQYNPNTFGAGFADTLAGNQLADPRTLGGDTATTLQDSFNKFFSDFATGALKGQKAFRDFASSVLSDESRLFAGDATKSIFGALGTAIGGNANGGYIGYASGGTIGGIHSLGGLRGVIGNILTPVGGAGGGAGGGASDAFTERVGHARGGFAYANGGSVPVMLTGGEFVFTPSQARRLGPQALQALNSGRVKGYADGGGVVRGGSGVRDDVPARLPAGSFVVKRSSAQGLGGGYLNALAGGAYAKRDSGGGIFGDLFSSGVGGDTEAGAAVGLIGAIIGAVADKKNRGQGALIGAGLGFGLGFGANALFNSSSPVNTAAVNAVSNDPSGPPAGGSPTNSSGNSFFGGSGNSDLSLSKLGVRLGAAGILGEGARLLNSPGSPMSFGQVRSNAVALETNVQNNYNSRPPGSFVNVVKGPNGQYNFVAYSNTAQEAYYGNNSSSTTYGYADGGMVGFDSGGSVGSIPSALPSPSNSQPVQNTVTIHNYGNGSTSSTSSSSGGGGGNPLGGADFANRLTKYINAAVQDQLVQSQRVGGAASITKRYSQVA